MGVILLLALASFAIVGYFSKHPHSESTWTSQIAPALAGLGLTDGVHPRLWRTSTC